MLVVALVPQDRARPIEFRVPDVQEEPFVVISVRCTVVNERRSDPDHLALNRDEWDLSRVPVLERVVRVIGVVVRRRPFCPYRNDRLVG
ncbi:MAG: hypothetical protein ACI8VE_001078 [Natrialbaceae archaeon]|jgi:hypothetical protein